MYVYVNGLGIIVGVEIGKGQAADYGVWTGGLDWRTVDFVPRVAVLVIPTG